MSKVTILNHPLIDHKMAIIRDKNTPKKLFRENVNLRNEHENLNHNEAPIEQNKNQIKKIGLALFLSPEQKPEFY